MRRRLGVLLGGLALATTGCVGIPDQGPIVESQSDVDPGEELGYYNDPRPPTPGAAPTEIVKGFLDAQAAIPVQTNTAEQFLTRDEAATWQPERTTVTYAAASLPRGSNRILVELNGANQINARGSWLGPVPRDEQELSFTMQREDGEWRIDDAPDALVVPESWFGQAYRRVSLYYFDPTARILVPEPVFVPRGDQFASALIDGLLRGPPGGRNGVERSAIPAGLDLDLSVSVTDEGIGQVDLLGGTSRPTERDASLMVAQIGRTLAQDSTLSGFRVSIDGEPLSVAGGETTFTMEEGSDVDPAGSRSTSLLFGLRQGRLVQGPPGALEPSTGPFGVEDQAVRSIGVNLSGARVAGVGSGGDRVLLTDVRDPDADVDEILSGGSDLLPPVWDFADRLWLLDRRSGSAQVLVRNSDSSRRPREVDVPGITGADVSRFLVSRDGSRLIGILDRRTDDRVLVSRLRYDARGRAVSGTPAREISWDDQTRLSLLDIGWSSPTSIVIAHRLSGDLFQARTMSVDGAPAGLTGLATTIQERPRGVASSPRATDPIYIDTRNGLLDALSSSRVALADSELTGLTYVGG